MARDRCNVKVNPRIKKLSDVLKRIPDAAVSDALKKMGDEFRTQERELFDTEGSSGGQRFAALSPRYKEWKDRFFGKQGAALKRRQRDFALLPSVYRKGVKRPKADAENKILQLTGRLKRSLSRKGDTDHIAEKVKSPRGWLLRLGTRVPYALYHAPGPFHSSRLPIRNPMQRTKEQEGRLLFAVRNALIPYITRSFRAAGLLSR